MDMGITCDGNDLYIGNSIHKVKDICCNRYRYTKRQQ